MSQSQPQQPYINHSKLHPIYVAIETHQYNKAIKLCLQQPGNLMAQALLAHSYVKMGQRTASLMVLHNMLPQSAFAELQLEVRQLVQLTQQQQAFTSSADSSPVSSSSSAPTAAGAATSSRSSKSKKGKKKGPTSGGPTPAAAVSNVTAAPASALAPSVLETTTEGGEVTVVDGAMDRLDAPHPIVLSKDWDRLPAASSVPALTDETLLSTLALLARNHLGLPLTAFQILCWGAASTTTSSSSSHPNSTRVLADAFLAGFFVLVSPRYQNLNLKVEESILASMQALAMQLLAKLQQQNQQQQLQLQQPQQSQTLQQEAGSSSSSSSSSSLSLSFAQTAWAAQTALWQWQFNPNNVLFPRLAESLALKCLMIMDANTTTTTTTATNNASTSEPLDTTSTLSRTENFLLYLQTLEIQGKREQQLAAIEERLAMGKMRSSSNSNSDINNDTISNSNSNDDLVYPPRPILLDRKARVLQELSQWSGARKVLETELLSQYPDDWSFWKRHLECAIAECCRDSSDLTGDDNDDDDGIALTEAFLSSVLEEYNNKISSNDCKYPLRGPRLMRVEIAARRFRRRQRSSSGTDSGGGGGDGSTDHCQNDLVKAIECYGNMFAPQSSSAFSDLCPYLELLLESSTSTSSSAASSSSSETSFRVTLLEWLRRLGPEPSSPDSKVRRNELRAYIFSTQMTYKLLAAATSIIDLRKEWLPNWVNLLKVWKTFQLFDPVTDEDQKENRPADELILLATQQLLCEDGSTSTAASASDAMKLQTAAAVLEAGIRYSPYNAHLKISAIFVYSELNAAARAWELFQTLHIKHIQYESCAYLILPVLWSGGMYVETISVCKEIVRLQRVAAQDAGEYSGRAMENGALSKADEFVKFQRERMNKSLTCLEAKGLVLDAAPLFVQDEKQPTLGAMQGIVGGPADIKRAYEIVANVQDPLSAFSVLQLKGSARDTVVNFSENRDFSVLSYDILQRRDFDTPEQVVRKSQRRGHIHSILIRSALIVEVTKGPKKGKVVPPSDALRRRSSSLLAYIAVTRAFCDDESIKAQSGDNNLFLRVLMNECEALAAVSSGLLPDSSISISETLESREDAACSLLEQVREGVKAAHQGLLPLSVSVVSRLLPECIVPVFAVFNMCAEVFDLYGWGKRKRKTKKCAEALASVSLALCALLDDMLLCLDRVFDHATNVNPYRELLVTSEEALVDEAFYIQTCCVILQAQELTKDRIGRVLRDIKSALQSFDVQE